MDNAVSMFCIPSRQSNFLMKINLPILYFNTTMEWKENNAQFRDSVAPLQSTFKFA